MPFAPPSPDSDSDARYGGLTRGCTFHRFLRCGFALTLAGLAPLWSAQPGIQERPLSARSTPAGATLFTPLSSAQTGIVAENAYDDPTMWWDLHQEFKFGAIGTGVAIGDIDNDGRPDVFIVNKTQGGRLFRNLGDWKFEDITARAGLMPTTGSLWDQGVAWARRLLNRVTATPTAVEGVWYQGATFVDVNNDGWLDLYICRYRAPNLLYINQGDGTFREEAAARGLAVNDASSMAAFADFDRDGWLDVYLQTNLLDVITSPTGQRDYLFRNNGDGTFTDVTDRAGISGLNQGHSVTWWDFDGDGWPDIYIANDFAPADHLYRNNRDGTFTDVLTQVVPTMPHSAMGADLGDVNNNGLIDLLVADMAATTREKDQRTMARIRSLLNDGHVDAAEAPQFMRNTLFINTGTRYMLEAGILAGLDATDWTWSVRFEDLDNDGRLDAHFTNGMVRELHNADLVQRISATENVAEGVRLLRASPPLAERNLAFRNLGGLQFEEVGASWGLDQVGVSFGAAFGDLDGDGDLDLIVANYESGPTILRNDSTTGHRVTVALRGTRSNRFGVGAIVRVETTAGVQVRPLVLARGYLSQSEPILHFGLGEADRIERLAVSWPSGYEQSFTGLAADRHFLITEPAAAPASPPLPRPSPPPTWFSEVTGPTGLGVVAREGRLSVHEQQPLLPFRQHRRGPALAVGDLDGAGAEALVLGGTTLDPSRVLRRAPAEAGGAAYLNQPLSAPGPVNDGPILIFDANGDGHPDVLITRSGTHAPADAPAYQPELWLNDGTGGLRPAPADTLPPLPISVGAAVAADFDRDGRLDLFLGGRVVPGSYPLPARSALLRQVGGRFVDVTDELAPGLAAIGLVTSALWTDVDGDGWIDLLLALEWGGIQYWRNDAGRGFTDQSTTAGFAAAGNGWWTSLAAADFNGDGRLDYVAGNHGLNTPYDASPSTPLVLLHGTFRPGGAPLIVEAYADDGQLFPRRARNELAPLLPALQRRLPRNDAFARATLDEIVGADRVAAARRFEVTELRSGVFLSQPDGTFRFQPFPHLAQIAPLQGIVTGDFDGDGHPDLLAVQNSFAPIPSSGRFAGGLGQLLRGDGQGGFAPVPPGESGVVVPGDAMALVKVDLDEDGWPDVVLTRNHDQALALRSVPPTAARPLRVDLQGGRGNPTAVGAQVTVHFTDGGTLTQEVYAGAGYMSQSTPRLYFALPAGRPVRELEVRWPSGARTRHPVAPDATHLRLNAPAR